MRDSNVVERHRFDGDSYPDVAFQSNANSDRSGSRLPLLCVSGSGKSSVFKWRNGLPFNAPYWASMPPAQASTSLYGSIWSLLALIFSLITGIPIRIRNQPAQSKKPLLWIRITFMRTLVLIFTLIRIYYRCIDNQKQHSSASGAAITLVSLLVQRQKLPH